MVRNLVSATAQAQLATPATDGIWSSNTGRNKGSVKLNLWRKRVGAPKPGEKPRPVLFLVHGSSNSTRSSYDLSVPGKGEYSLMNVMARDGYRRLDHGPRRLRPLRQLRQQLRHRQRRRGSQGRDAGRGEGDRRAEDAFLRHVVGRDPRRRLRARRIPSASTGLSSAPSPTRAPARRRSRGAPRVSTNCAPTRGASATPP